MSEKARPRNILLLVEDDPNDCLLFRRAVAKTREGVPALLEFITEKAEDFSMFA